MNIKALVLLSISLTICYADEWSSFRGNSKLTGVANPISPPLKNVWVYETKLSIKSTAAIVDNCVYIGTSKGVIALNLKNGKKAWQFKSSEPVKASPCVVGNDLYIGDESGYFYKLDIKTGKLVWKYECEDKIISSATYSSGKILFGCYDNFLYCLDQKGKKLWAFETEAQVHGTPCVANSSVFIAGCDGWMRMVDLKTGKEQKKFNGKSYFAASAAYLDGCVYIGSLGGEYFGIAFPQGKSLWQLSQKENWGENLSNAAVVSQKVIFASKKRKVFCLHPKTGKLLWKFQGRGKFESSPVIAGKYVWVTMFNGYILALDLQSGKPVWKYKTGSRIYSSAAIAQKHLVVGCDDGAIYCFKE